jgi:hypothetical protein
MRMRVRKRLSVLAIAIVAMLAVATSGSAITNGQPDGGNHPYVGLMVAIGELEGQENVPLWRCSGSLLSPDVFLTAGHCTAPDEAAEATPTHVEVWFASGPVLTDPDYTAAVLADPDGIVSCDASPLFDGYPCVGDAGGTPNTNPGFCIGCGNGLPGFAIRDVGVVAFDSPLSTSVVDEYADLPSAGQINGLKNKTAIDFVGFGVQFQAQVPGNLLPQPPPFFRWAGPRTRMFAPSELVSGNFVHSAEFLRLALNPGGGSGGTCFGDSGGPDLLGGSDTVLAVNSYVTNVNCSGVGYSSRVDIPAVLSWIESFM